MRIGPPLPVQCTLHAAVDEWLTHVLWSRLRGGETHKPGDFLDYRGHPVFRANLTLVIHHAVVGEMHKAWAVVTHTVTGERTVHPVTLAPLTVHLDGPLAAHATVPNPDGGHIEGGRMLVEITAQAPLLRMVELFRVATYLTEQAPVDVDDLMHGWATLHAFDIPLPDRAPVADVGRFLRAHTGVPDTLMYRAVRADFTYPDATTLVAREGETSALHTLDTMLGLQN